jgi:hypothetical protein
MEEGWINKRQRKLLNLKMARTDFRFFSLFGFMPSSMSGNAQNHGHGRSTLLLPTIPSKRLVTHELGHAFASIDSFSIYKYFTKKIGKKEAFQKSKQISHLFTILNEGFNEHMTAALMEGGPTIISPKERTARGIAETVSSAPFDSYNPYREIFGVLMGGEEGRVTKNGMSEIIDSMVANDIHQFARLIGRKWGGREVLLEMLHVIEEHDSDKEGSSGSLKYNEELAKKITVRLRRTKDENTVNTAD